MKGWWKRGPSCRRARIPPNHGRLCVLSTFPPLPPPFPPCMRLFLQIPYFQPTRLNYPGSAQANAEFALGLGAAIAMLGCLPLSLHCGRKYHSLLSRREPIQYRPGHFSPTKALALPFARKLPSSLVASRTISGTGNSKTPQKPGASFARCRLHDPSQKQRTWHRLLMPSKMHVLSIGMYCLVMILIIS